MQVHHNLKFERLTHHSTVYKSTKGVTTLMVVCHSTAT